jgi:hypothetical protein
MIRNCNYFLIKCTTIDQNGFVLGYDDYDPFGNVLPGRSSNFATPNDDNKFTGHERDTEGNYVVVSSLGIGLIRAFIAFVKSIGEDASKK